MSQFKQYDVVEIKAAYLKKRHKKGSFTPADLVGIGWPNRFQVLQVGTDEDGEEILSLDPCCMWMADKAKKDEDFLCRAHPAEWFRPIREEKKRTLSPHNLSIRTPVGELFRVEYSDDKDEPCMEIQVGSGDPLILGGKMSKLLAGKFKDAGLL